MSKMTQGNKRKDALTAIGITEDQETYIGTSDWWIGEDAAIFGNEFETALRGAFPTYEDLEDKAKEQGIDSKPFIARWVAEHAQPDDAVEGWQKIDELIDRLKAKLSTNH